MNVRLHDGSGIDVVIEGEGPAILLPVNPVPIEGPQADEMRKWGADPALGRTLIEGLSRTYRVISFDYEGHVLQVPKADTLTPEHIAADFLRIADAAGAERFAYYGYSWLALSGLQLALRTDRLSALVMGGYPPVDGPYEEMLKVTMATHEMSTANASGSHPSETAQTTEWGESSGEYDWADVEVSMSEEQTRQFVTLYEHLRDFDDRTALSRLTCPRLCFAGSKDRIEYGEKWGDVTVDIISPLIRYKNELTEAGWDVRILDGLDHTGAMQAKHVLPVLLPWLDSHLRGK